MNSPLRHCSSCGEPTESRECFACTALNGVKLVLVVFAYALAITLHNALR